VFTSGCYVTPSHCSLSLFISLICYVLRGSRQSLLWLGPGTNPDLFFLASTSNNCNLAIKFKLTLPDLIHEEFTTQNHHCVSKIPERPASSFIVTHPQVIKPGKDRRKIYPWITIYKLFWNLYILLPMILCM
jgi:hypothetical protein